jgi:hypothetical protein
VKLRCKLGIHARIARPRPSLLAQRELWCRHCPGRWSLFQRAIGGNMVVLTERLEDRKI